MQTILGAGGDIGVFLAKALRAYTDRIRLVARNPQKVNETDELFAANLLDAEAVSAAVAGSDVAYLVVGLPYDHRIWEKQWPVVMQNVIDACCRHNCKLVFFDNIYMYAPTAIPHMTEESSVQPVSRKGKVRAQLVKMIFDAIETKGLQALIARSADFYGPGAKNGVLNVLVLNNMKKGKKANWQADAKKIHSFTYTPDAAKATAMLGNTASAYNQAWHLPTSAERLNGKQYIALAAAVMNRKPSCFVLSPFLIGLAGLFSTMIRELKEMQYQNTQDYFFDSRKFNDFFSFTPTTYAAGIRETLLHDE